MAFLVAYAVPIAVPTTTQATRNACELIVLMTWIAFAADYLARLSLSERRWTFVKLNPLDLAVIALPVLRPLRLLRLVALARVLNRVGSSTLRGRVVTYVVGSTALLITCGALAVTDAERGRPGANIANLGDGFWWAITTMTTVGYGDRYPTTTGRAVAVALMIAGVALLGVVTATLASWLVERVAEATDVEQAASRAEVEQLTAEVRRLVNELSARLEPARPGHE
ncbi:potassium channel family protein [Cellulomonas cellasea]|uniref:potassium channel family protein n=1 Tax=Cellulomonas cellasea TaxID=43670 RepID=UPI0025A328E2|nr:potassium channel family protein [Cellulomonas cellasea]MDM8083318.1 potassium channel family protein [Cellulomonas cellasea]